MQNSIRKIIFIEPYATDIQFKKKAAIKGTDKYVKLFVIWLSIDRLLPNCKLSMKTSAKNISINDLLGLKH